MVCDKIEAGNASRLPNGERKFSFVSNLASSLIFAQCFTCLDVGTRFIRSVKPYIVVGQPPHRIQHASNNTGEIERQSALRSACGEELILIATEFCAGQTPAAILLTLYSTYQG